MSDTRSPIDPALKESAKTMSISGESGGVRIRGLNDQQSHEVYYFGLFPNLLISLRPDYVMAHRFEPISPTETKVECQRLFPPEAKDVPGFSPTTRASSGTSRTGRTGWRASR
jgi:glycine betaine catabolism A